MATQYIFMMGSDSLSLSLPYLLKDVPDPNGDCR